MTRNVSKICFEMTEIYHCSNKKFNGQEINHRQNKKNKHLNTVTQMFCLHTINKFYQSNLVLILKWVCFVFVATLKTNNNNLLLFEDIAKYIMRQFLNVCHWPLVTIKKLNDLWAIYFPKANWVKILNVKKDLKALHRIYSSLDLHLLWIS